MIQQILDTQSTNLIAYWPLGETANPYENLATGATEDVTITGTVAHVAGLNGDAVEFNGASSTAVAPLSAPTVWTLLGYVKAEANEEGFLFGFTSTTSALPLAYVKITAGELITSFRAASEPSNADTHATGFDDGQWHGVAIVNDGSSIEVYIDGVPVSDEIVMFSLTANQFVLGALVRTSANAVSQYFDGALQHVAVWESALTAAEILAINNAANAPPVVTGPVAYDLSTEPSYRLVASEAAIVKDSETYEVSEWLEAGGTRHAEFDDTLHDAKPLYAHDEGFPGILIRKNADSIGLDIPDSVSGPKEDSAGFCVITPLYERKGNISRFIAVGPLLITFADDAGDLYRTLRVGTKQFSQFPTSFNRQVIGYRRANGMLTVFVNGETATIADTDSGEQVGGYLGAEDSYGIDALAGWVHEIAAYLDGNLNAVQFEAVGQELMSRWNVRPRSERILNLITVGDSMANLGDTYGVAKPFGWGDLIDPILPSEFYVESIPGWFIESARAELPNAVARKSLFNATYNVAFVAIGTNNLTTQTTSELVANLEQLWAEYQAAGYTVIGCTIPPRVSQDAVSVNASLRNSNVPDYFVDFEQELPEMMGGEPIGDLWNVDGVHPSLEGYRLYATQANQKLNEILANISRLEISDVPSGTAIPSNSHQIIRGDFYSAWPNVFTIEDESDGDRFTLSIRSWSDKSNSSPLITRTVSVAGCNVAIPITTAETKQLPIAKVKWDIKREVSPGEFVTIAFGASPVIEDQHRGP